MDLRYPEHYSTVTFVVTFSKFVVSGKTWRRPNYPPVAAAMISRGVALLSDQPTAARRGSVTLPEHQRVNLQLLSACYVYVFVALYAP